MKQLKAIIIGAGDRGVAYSNRMKAKEEKFKVVGVAEPIENRRNNIQKIHNLTEDCCFDSWEKILSMPKFADVAVISTMDRLHCAPTLKALEMGYDVLLEKPAAPTPEECIKILKQAKKYNRKVMICHVLRYTPFYNKLKQIIESGEIGDVISVVHNEDVEAIHQSHSFVRGNWGNSGRSSCMLLQKSCHDLDIIQWLLNKECKRVQSFGSLQHFTTENAPAGAPDYCVDGCPEAENCIYNASKINPNDNISANHIGWYRTTATHLTNPTKEDAERAIRTTQYGKCVYKCDNDVVDHQTVNMEFEDGITVVFTMCAFANAGRTTKIMGTKGWIWASVSDDKIEVTIHGKEEKKQYGKDTFVDSAITGGHGGGDSGIVDSLHSYINGEKTSAEVSEIDISCKNHMLAFAAEESRHTGTVVDFEEYLQSMGLYD